MPSRLSEVKGDLVTLPAVEAAALRRWSDETEAVAGLLGAAGVLGNATAQRRALARDLVRRKATASDVLAWLRLHHHRGAGWLLAGLRADPEAVWKARSSGAPEATAGPVDKPRVDAITGLLGKIVARAAAESRVPIHGNPQDKANEARKRWRASS
jgi:hypothetical protein